MADSPPPSLCSRYLGPVCKPLSCIDVADFSKLIPRAKFAINLACDLRLIADVPTHPRPMAQYYGAFEC